MTSLFLLAIHLNPANSSSPPNPSVTAEKNLGVTTASFPCPSSGFRLSLVPMFNILFIFHVLDCIEPFPYHLFIYPVHSVNIMLLVKKDITRNTVVYIANNISFYWFLAFLVTFLLLLRLSILNPFQCFPLSYIYN